MRFARIASACLVLLVLLTPAKLFIRSNLPTNFITYAAVLASAYFCIMGLLWGGRDLLVYSDAWETSGLEDLDHGVDGSGWFRWTFGLGFLLVGSSIFYDGKDVARSIVESTLCVGAGIFAIVGGFQPRIIDDVYDPIPPAVPYPAPGPDQQETDNHEGDGELRDLTMEWYFKPEPGSLNSSVRNFRVQITASMKRYQELASRNHATNSNQDYARFVTEGTTPEVISVARQMRNISTSEAFGSVVEINNILAFAQRFKYVSDMESKGRQEYPKFPLETYIDDHGDCEDHAIVAAACLKQLGYDVRLVGIEYHHQIAGHMALAVSGAENVPAAYALTDPKTGKKYYYCEATADASSTSSSGVTFRMGEIQDEERRAVQELIKL